MAGVPPYRLRWDDQNLILEEWDEGLGYVERAKSRSGVSNPVSTGHPELQALLKESLKRIKDNWLEAGKPVCIMLAPPWGSGWLLDLKDMDDDILEDMVEWELSRRLDDDLSEYIYAWQPIGQRIYAFVVRPEIIAFWEELVRTLRMNIHSITLHTGLVPADVEMSADLLTLYRIWQRNTGQTPAGQGVIGEDEEDLDTSAFETPHQHASAPAPGGSKLKGILLVAALVVVLLGVGGVVAVTQLDGPKQFVAGLLEKVPFLQPEEEPKLTAGETLTAMYQYADTLDVQVSSLLLQGGDMRLLVTAKEGPMMQWAKQIASMEGFDSLRIGANVPEADDVVFFIRMHETDDSTMTEMQFLDNLKLLGLNPDPMTHAELSREQRDELLNLMDAAVARPFRLSIHTGLEEGQYFIAGLP